MISSHDANTTLNFKFPDFYLSLSRNLTLTMSKLVLYYSKCNPGSLSLAASTSTYSHPASPPFPTPRSGLPFTPHVPPLLCAPLLQLWLQVLVSHLEITNLLTGYPSSVSLPTNPASTQLSDYLTYKSGTSPPPRPTVLHRHSTRQGSRQIPEAQQAWHPEAQRVLSLCCQGKYSSQHQLKTGNVET